MFNVRENDIDNDLIIYVYSKENVVKDADIKVCKDKDGFKYTIWILDDQFFQKSEPSSSDKRQAPKTGNRANYTDRIDCRDLNDLMQNLLEYYKQNAAQ